MDGLKAQWAKVQSFTATMKVQSDLHVSTGIVRTNAIARYEYLKRGESRLFRVETQLATVNYASGTDDTAEGHVTMVCDGRHVYTLREQGQDRKVVKESLDAASVLDAPSVFEAIKPDYYLTLLPDETLNGQDVRVLQAKPIDRRVFIYRKLLYFAKDSGLLVKSLTYDNDDHVVSDETLTDIRLNVDLSPSRFEFTPPPGIPIEDRTAAEASTP